MREDQRRPVSLVSRRSLVKGGLSAVAVAAATIITARDGGAAVTSMDNRMFTISSTPGNEGNSPNGGGNRAGYGENTAAPNTGPERVYVRQGR